MDTSQAVTSDDALSPRPILFSLFQRAGERLRASIMQARQRFQARFSEDHRSTRVPPFGRVRKFRTRRRRRGRGDTYVILQVPENAGNLASTRIASALRRSLDSSLSSGLSRSRRRNLYLILTELVRFPRS